MHAVLRKLGQIVLADDVVADVGEQSGVQAEAGGGDGRVRAVADSVADVDRLVGNLVAEAERELAVLAVEIAGRLGVLEADKGLGRDVADGEEIVVLLSVSLPHGAILEPHEGKNRQVL